MQIKRTMIRYIAKEYKFFENIQGKTVNVREFGNPSVKWTDSEIRENRILVNIIIICQDPLLSMIQLMMDAFDFVSKVIVSY